MAILPTVAGASDPEWEKRTSQWFETVEPGGRLRVVNPLGDVRARFGGYEGRLEILATTQVPAGTSRPPEVRREPSGQGLNLTVTPSADGAGGTPERVDLVLFVPQGAVLDVETVRGTIDVKGVRGDVMLASLEGDVRIRGVLGAVRAKTPRGSISAQLENGVTEASQELTTETGDIEVLLWEDADFRVRLATSGEISTDFSIHIEHRRFEEPGKHGVVDVGDATASLTLTSKRGRIGLVRLPRDYKPRDD